MEFATAFFLSVLVVCGTRLFQQACVRSEAKYRESVREEIENLRTKFYGIDVKVDTLEAEIEDAKLDSDSIKKLAEETKKLLSEERLAKGLRLQR